MSRTSLSSSIEPSDKLSSRLNEYPIWKEIKPRNFDSEHEKLLKLVEKYDQATEEKCFHEELIKQFLVLFRFLEEKITNIDEKVSSASVDIAVVYRLASEELGNDLEKLLANRTLSKTSAQLHSLILIEQLIIKKTLEKLSIKMMDSLPTEKKPENSSSSLFTPVFFGLTCINVFTSIHNKGSSFSSFILRQILILVISDSIQNWTISKQKNWLTSRHLYNDIQEKIAILLAQKDQMKKIIEISQTGKMEKDLLHIPTH